MDFKDWRKESAPPTPENQATKLRGKRFADYIEEQINEAQKRGIFDNLPGAGKPLNLDENPYAGEKALGYSILKGSGHAPAEIELAKEVRQKLEQLDQPRRVLSQRYQKLRHRTFLSSHEKEAYNHAVTQALEAYEKQLRELNSKILTLNLSTPSAMHRAPLSTEEKLAQFREACPLFS